MPITCPTESFNEDLLFEEEVAVYGETVQAVGLLSVRDKETNTPLMNDDDNSPWFLIEHMTDKKLFMDTTEKYFRADDPEYIYEWVAFRT